MEQYIIKGGNPLVGEVEIGGAKNAALAILAAAIMTDETVLIDNLPDVNDINVMLEAISGIGATVQRLDRHTVKINGSAIGNFNIEYDYIKKIRASYYLLGALLGKYKRAEVALPGGCNIGSRPIDQHLKAFTALGAEDVVDNGMIEVSAPVLRGEEIFFDTVSVGATINAMLAAVMADGLTVLENVAKEPHIVDVANFLNTMGADVRGAGTDVIKVHGVRRMHGCTYTIIPDQIEAGSYMVGAAITGGNVLIKNVIPKHLEPITSKLEKAGAHVEEYDDSVRVSRTGDIEPLNIKTMPHPGFPTDMQPLMSVLLTLAKGTSIITEGIWENRFRYVDELVRMGVNIQVAGRVAVIEGVQELLPAPMRATDLRAGAAMIMAALAADGVSEITEISHIERGYEDIAEKLRGLGADIRRIEQPDRPMRRAQ